MVEREHQGFPITYQYLTHDTILPPYLYSTERQPIHSLPLVQKLHQYNSPLSWSNSYKNFCTLLICVSTLITTYTPGAYTSGIAQYEEEWNVSSTAIYVGVSLFTLCFAVTPIVLAPFSEQRGRKPVLILSGFIFTASQLGSALTTSFVGMIVSRVTAGMSCSVFSSICAGVLSDIYCSEERNTPMAIFSGSALFGAGLGPLCSGILAQNLPWRWIFYIQTMTSGVTLVCYILFFKETRGSILLARKARILNQWHKQCEQAGFSGLEENQMERGRVRWKIRTEESLGATASSSLLRPLHFLFTESIVFFFSLWMAFAWSILYMTFEAVPFVFSSVYGFDRKEAGLVFISVCVASVLFSILSIYQDKAGQQCGKVPKSKPEGRLYFACIESVLLPIGLLWFGWTANSSISTIIPTLAVGCITMGIFSVYLAVFNYLADTYHQYASSAIAAQSFTRNIFAAAIPLFTDQMFKRMTIRGASSFLGLIGLLLTLVPWILVLYGANIRKRSRFI